MIKLRQLFESSARDRLKARVKNRPQLGVEPDKEYLDRVTTLYKRNPERLKRNYENFMKDHATKKDYLPGLIGIFNLISLGIGYTGIRYPADLSRVGSREKVNLELARVMGKAKIPEEFDLTTAAYFLQVLEEKGGVKVGGI